MRSSWSSSRSREASSSSASARTALRASLKAAARAPRTVPSGSSIRRSGSRVVWSRSSTSRAAERIVSDRLGVGDDRVRLDEQRRDSVVEALAQPRLEDQLASRRPQRVVDADEHLAEPRRLVGREQLPAVGLVGGAERVERRVERLALQHARLRLVEHPEPRVDAGCERIGGQEPAAEAVDRRDPGAVEVAREIRTLELEQPRPDPRAKLPGGAIGVGDHEQRVDVEPVVDHRAGEPLDENGRLPRARPGRDEGRAAGVDRRLLLRVRGSDPERGKSLAHGRSLRQMRQRSHQAGHSPPRGSWITSPSRMRSARTTADARACSISASNAGPSR